MKSLIHKICRRNFLGAAGVLLAGSYLPAARGEELIEIQQGDPDLPGERLVYNKQAIANASGLTKGLFEKVPQNFNQLFLAEASGWVGKNRINDKYAIADLLDLFNLPFSQNGNPVPFCAAGVSYVAAMVYAKIKASESKRTQTSVSPIAFLPELDNSHFYPTPSVNDMFLVAQGKRRWISGIGDPTPKPGWLVVFVWKGHTPNHVGIVSDVEKGVIKTIEFNTSVASSNVAAERQGGYVARRVRAYPSKEIRGFIKTY